MQEEEANELSAEFELPLLLLVAVGVAGCRCC